MKPIRPMRWFSPGKLSLLLLLPLLGPALLTAGCALEPEPENEPAPGPVSPTPRSDLTTAQDAVSPAPELDLSAGRERAALAPKPTPGVVAKGAIAPPSLSNPASNRASNPAQQFEDESPAASAEALFFIPVSNVAAELVAPRPEYDTDTDIAAMIKPHFLARTAAGDLVEISARRTRIVEWQGKAALRLTGGDVAAYVDLLALQSELLGEHPAHKIYRLLAMGIPLSDDLRRKLLDESSAGELFTNVAFEYLRGKEATGVVSEIFPDGSLLVIPFDLPREWQSRDARIASPTHLHLNPRALSAGVSDLAREYEREILALPFPEQRYPATPLVRKQCDLYRESLEHLRYASLLDSLGFRFTPRHVTEELAETGASFGERLTALLWNGSGAGVRYFGFEGDWISDRLRQEGVAWLGDCDTAGGLRRYQAAGEERYYLTVRRSLEPDKKQRYRILTLDEGGAATEIYTAPGIILMALPLPGASAGNDEGGAWLLSAEGWPEATGGQPADPRWQAVYRVDLANPQEYRLVRYPLEQFPDAPETGLYGVSPRLSADGRHLFNTLYGFRDEGGGIWVVDLAGGNFYDDPSRFSRIVAWDHTLSWTLLDNPAATDSPYLHLFMTGKEVADDFAMTANILRIREAGLESSIEREERLLQMVGWNPVPFGWQRLSDTRYRVLVETHYNYESSLLPRAKGVYIIPVDLGVAGGR